MGSRTRSIVSYFASGLLKPWIRVEALRTSFKTSIVSMTERSKICDTLIRLPILAPILNVNLGYIHTIASVSRFPYLISKGDKYSRPDLSRGSHES